MKTMKLIMAVLLLLCLAPMPYGYYMLVRFISMVVFAIMALNYTDKQNTPLSVTFGALALLFQPFVKIALGRTVWNLVDVVVAFLLLFLYFSEKDENVADN